MLIRGPTAHFPASCADAATVHRTATAKINNFFIIFSFGIGLHHQIYEQKTIKSNYPRHIYPRRTIFHFHGRRRLPSISTHEHLHIDGMAILTSPSHTDGMRLRNIRLTQKNSFQHTPPHAHCTPRNDTLQKKCGLPCSGQPALSYDTRSISTPTSKDACSCCNATLRSPRLHGTTRQPLPGTTS